MKTVFEKLGYVVSETKTSLYTQEIKLLVINNPNGTIRWVWPSEMKNPLFLKLYNNGNLRGRLFCLVMKIIFLFRIQKLIFKSKSLFCEGKGKESQAIKIFKNWALFTGTPGINNKSILYTEYNGVSSFTKIASTEQSSYLLENESYALDRLYGHTFTHFEFPDVLSQTTNLLVLSDISAGGKRVNEYGPIHTRVLSELNEISSFLTPLSELKSWHDLKSDLHHIQKLNDHRIPKGMVKKLIRMTENMNEFLPIEMTFSHGDFTSWNMFIKNNKLNIYDWELSSPLKPVGFDAFHFIIQQGVLVQKKSWKEIKKEIDQKLDENTFTRLSQFNNVSMKHYLELYLIFNCIHYLKVYSQQPNWHLQINWLLTAWNDAISEFSVGFENQREIILLDIFDFLNDKNYAAIKFPNILPEKLSKESDIDLCIEKDVNTLLFGYLKNHPLVAKIKSSCKSFMTNRMIVCKDGSFLSLDLIWKVKRKNTVMMEANELLAHSYRNSFGIKCLDLLDNVRYIGLFYALNNFPIPHKYKMYSEVLVHSKNNLDQELLPFFIDDEKNTAKNLISFLKNNKNNQRLSKVVNSLSYFIDTIRGFSDFGGFVISFSGVDGAGKSTVIEKVKQRLEKQLRKKVIVIRHRPSILPILSALTKGKAAAEKASVSKLPRQGTNTSIVSSLLRFSYYYVDYLVGQFVVYAKYITRGYVVLYDRYYYDFINDSKRSNILLPKSFTRAAFNFIMKPQLNFFLYAEAEVIQSRKKELEVKTIEELTDNYLTLFKSLKQKNTKNHFEAIENIDLNTTLSAIFTSINKIAA